METKDLYQEYLFPASPLRVFECYLDEDEHGDITGGEAEIEAFEEGNFSAFDGYSMGTMKELELGKLIVQSWRAEEPGWPEDHYTQIRMVLEEHPDGCLLKFSQTGIPATLYEAIAKGWIEFYWEPMEEHLQNS
jgi:activator of HSP90 ATPase